MRKRTRARQISKSTKWTAHSLTHLPLCFSLPLTSEEKSRKTEKNNNILSISYSFAALSSSTLYYSFAVTCICWRSQCLNTSSQATSVYAGFLFFLGNTTKLTFKNSMQIKEIHSGFFLFYFHLHTYSSFCRQCDWFKLNCSLLMLWA